MSEIKKVYKQCDECYLDVEIMEMSVIESAEGLSIYCPECVKRRKFREQEMKRLCKLWNIDPIKYGREVERQEKRMLRENKEEESKSKYNTHTRNNY